MIFDLEKYRKELQSDLDRAKSAMEGFEKEVEITKQTMAKVYAIEHENHYYDYLLRTQNNILKINLYREKIK